jgi:hypothetical protein
MNGSTGGWGGWNICTPAGIIEMNPRGKEICIFIFLKRMSNENY